jgi:hypothetical protein
MLRADPFDAPTATPPSVKTRGLLSWIVKWTIRTIANMAFVYFIIMSAYTAILYTMYQYSMVADTVLSETAKGVWAFELFTVSETFPLFATLVATFMFWYYLRDYPAKK